MHDHITGYTKRDWQQVKKPSFSSDSKASPAAAALMNRYSRQSALTDMVKCGNSAQCSAAKQKLRQLQLFYEFAEHNRRRWRRWPNASTLQSLSQSTSLPASGTSFCKESVNLMSSSGSGKPHFWGTHCTLYTVCGVCSVWHVR